MSRFHLAQLNIAIMKHPLESPPMGENVLVNLPVWEDDAPDAKQVPYTLGDQCPAT